MDKINNRRRKERRTPTSLTPLHPVVLRIKPGGVCFDSHVLEPKIWCAQGQDAALSHQSKEKMSLLGEEAKAFGNSWLILDKTGGGVSRFGAQASVFAFKNHLETENHVRSPRALTRPEGKGGQI